MLIVKLFVMSAFFCAYPAGATPFQRRVEGALPRLMARSEALRGRYQGYNVVVVSLTGAGARHMSLYGHQRPTTPNLEKWAKDALVFESAFAHASWTSPSVTSLLTSLYPYTHGVWRRQRDNRLAPQVVTLPDVFSAAGYATAVIGGGLDYHPILSQFRGFEYKERNSNYSPLAVTVPQATKWISAQDGRPFFLLLQGYDAHCPFVSSAPYRGTFSSIFNKSPDFDSNRCVRGFRESGGSYNAVYAGGCPIFQQDRVCTPAEGAPVKLTEDDVRFIEASYDETMLQADEMAARFLSSLPPEISSRTIIILTADHGEMFAKHGRFGRAGTRRGAHYDDVLHIPLLVRLPGVAGRRVAGLAQTVDLMPTLLDLLGIDAPSTVQGASLLPLIESGRPVHDAVYSGLPYNLQPMREISVAIFGEISLSESIRDKSWKLLHERLVDRKDAEADSKNVAGETWELYDVAVDPDEQVDVSTKQPQALAAMRARLEHWREMTLAARPRQAAGSDKLPAALLRKAKERGYWE